VCCGNLKSALTELRQISIESGFVCLVEVPNVSVHLIGDALGDTARRLGQVLSDDYDLFNVSRLGGKRFHCRRLVTHQRCREQRDRSGC
jgi:hypothetical protein